VKSLAALCILSLMPVMALAADVSGKWTGRIAGGDGRDVVLTLKSDGAKVTGSMTSATGKEAPITKGELQGEAISLTIASEWQGSPITLLVKGAVEGDEMKLTMGNTDSSWSTDLILKRSKQ
jgi:hypothetical protein